MRKASLKHENLKRVIHEIQNINGEVPDETFEKFINELKHSSLIVAGDKVGSDINIMTVQTNHGDFGLLFTDMDEYAKIFQGFEVESHENFFSLYLDMLRKTDLQGFIINFRGEGMFLPRNILNMMNDMPSYSYSYENSYTSEELKTLKDSINNEKLEEFIQNPSNTARYGELFEMISSSTMLTLMVSIDNLQSEAKNGIISTEERESSCMLYIDKTCGEYVTVYTSEDKISNVKTPLNKYSQIINFSHIAHFVLNEDMDGIIINPGDENIVITRDVLLEFSPVLERTCNDSRLNAGVFLMFPLKNEVYV